MASVSTSHLIIFVASLVVAAGVVGTLTTGVDRVSSAIQDGSLDVSQQVRTDVTIISDPGSDVYNETNASVTIHVRNTGSQTLSVQDSTIDIFLNGQYKTGEDLQIELVSDANAAVWRPDEVVEVTLYDVDGDIADDNRIFITVNGDEEVFEFRS
ncbi:MAG: flagellar protein G [Halobacteriota archaeon]